VRDRISVLLFNFVNQEPLQLSNRGELLTAVAFDRGSIGKWSVMSEVFETGNRRPRLDISYTVDCIS
jgi:hypothetical protein